MTDEAVLEPLLQNHFYHENLILYATHREKPHAMQTVVLACMVSCYMCSCLSRTFRGSLVLKKFNFMGKMLHMHENCILIRFMLKIQ
jgi:hypothetical protein